MDVAGAAVSAPAPLPLNWTTVDFEYVVQCADAGWGLDEIARYERFKVAGADGAERVPTPAELSVGLAEARRRGIRVRDIDVRLEENRRNRRLCRLQWLRGHPGKSYDDLPLKLLESVQRYRREAEARGQRPPTAAWERDDLTPVETREFRRELAAAGPGASP